MNIGKRLIPIALSFMLLNTISYAEIKPAIKVFDYDNRELIQEFKKPKVESEFKNAKKSEKLANPT